ncbi:cyclic nucleotide-gated ion channel [Roseibium suaedae]|uniref:Voltage-gated potassium channel n=1 Tax=Roseibium suaedae TaxID=735517 RepID=A0A1M7GDD5_9HYPH|nr:cyclic nucleotide-gated ion channel [Roseibium suaedae]SHM14290.1 voltage-gated potassium channel [Roseibium suaedae]
MLKRTLYDLLEDTGNRRIGARLIRRGLVLLILINVASAVLETLPGFEPRPLGPLMIFQLICGVGFVAEYVLRLYIADLHPPLRRYGPIGARLRYALQPDAIVDLIAALPLILVLVLPNSAVTVIVILRLLRFLKLARYSPALRSLLSAIASERHALMGSTVIICGVVLMAATLMYVIEHDEQPEKLASIPHAIWWAVTTVTTVGYGDVVPVTGLGKVIGGIVMLLGYGLIALPVGIVASAFAREIHSRDFVVTWSMVARVPLFEDLKAAEIAEVAKLLRAQRVRAGTVIASKGDVASRMYFISDGEVEIELPREKIYLGEGKFFGEISLLHQRPRTATIRAFHDCELLVLEADALTDLMSSKTELAARIMAEVEERTADLRKESGDLVQGEIAQAEGREELVEEQPELFEEKPDGEETA